MGTTTFFLRHNDLGKPLNKMGKKELEKTISIDGRGHIVLLIIEDVKDEI